MCALAFDSTCMLSQSYDWNGVTVVREKVMPTCCDTILCPVSTTSITSLPVVGLQQSGSPVWQFHCHRRRRLDPYLITTPYPRCHSPGPT